MGVRVMRCEEGGGLGMAIDEPENFLSPNVAAVCHMLKMLSAIECFWSYSTTGCSVIATQHHSGHTTATQ